MTAEHYPCIGNDPSCPCQDGDVCHYVDAPGSPAMPATVGDLIPDVHHKRLALLRFSPRRGSLFEAAVEEFEAAVRRDAILSAEPGQGEKA